MQISDVPDLCTPFSLSPSFLEAWKKLPLSLALQTKDRSNSLGTLYKPINLDTKYQAHFNHQPERCRSPLGHCFLQQDDKVGDATMARNQDSGAIFNIRPSTFQTLTSKTSTPIHFWSSINPIPGLSSYSPFQFPFQTNSPLVFPGSTSSPLAILSPTKGPISVFQ